MHSIARGQVRQSSNAPKLQYLIDNQWKTSEATEYIEVRNPATQEVVSLVPKMTQAEMNAVADSSAAGLCQNMAQYYKYYIQSRYNNSEI